MNWQKKIKKILKNKKFQKFEKWFSLIFWLMAIYYLSSQPLNFFVAFDVWEYIIRKLAHMFEYAVLTFLIFRILRQTEKKQIYWNLAWTLVFTVLYAISDEYHQTFVFGRTGTYTDVLIDSFGALIAIWLIYLNYHHHKILKRKRTLH